FWHTSSGGSFGTFWHRGRSRTRRSANEVWRSRLPSHGTGERGPVAPYPRRKNLAVLDGVGARHRVLDRSHRSRAEGAVVRRGAGRVAEQRIDLAPVVGQRLPEGLVGGTAGVRSPLVGQRHPVDVFLVVLVHESVDGIEVVGVQGVVQPLHHLDG